MNVLVFSTLYPNNIWPNHGVFVKERMTHWAKLTGAGVQVVAPVPYYPPIPLGQRRLFSQVVQYEHIEGIAVHHPRYVMIPKIGMSVHGWMMFRGVLPYIKRLRQTFSFDLIDAHFVYPDGMAAVLLGRYLKCPVVVSARGSDIHQFSDMQSIRPLLRWTLRHADKVIAVSTNLKEGMMRLGCPEEKISVIPNGVDTKKFSPLDEHMARQKTGLSTEKVILTVARLVPNKGCDLLIRAFKALVEDSNISMSLAIVGEGPLLANLERLQGRLNLEKNVWFVGRVSHSELPWWYNSATVSCLVSEREGCPNVVLESLACGTPVVATRAGSVPDTIVDDEVGFLTERNPSAIAQCLRRAIRKEWNKRRIRDYAETQSWDSVAKRVHGVFESLVGQACLLVLLLIGVVE